MFVFDFFAGESFVVVVLDRVFFHWGTKKWSLVALDRWSFYTVTIVWELAWTGLALVVLDKWSSYRGGRGSRFDCIYLFVFSYYLCIPCLNI